MQTYPPGTRIGQYEIASRPMMGGMGVVYFALDRGNDGRPVALKTFRPELLPDRAARDRFLREGTAWIELGSHPHIVRCYKVEYIDPAALLVLELIAKEQTMPDASLRSWLIPGHPLPFEQALLFSVQIARGMQHATNKIPGFVHRDLKPENILVGADKLPNTNINRLRVTDFGLIKAITDSNMASAIGKVEELKPNQTQFTRGVGTPLYMAPEQWKGEPVGVFTDVYAFGCILYEILTGHHAADGKTITELQVSHCEGRLRAMPSNLPKGIVALLEKCLVLKPNQRYSMWEEIIDSLNRSCTEQSGQALRHIKESAELSRDERVQAGWSASEIGLSYFDIGKIDIALQYFERALVIGTAEGAQKLQAAALNNTGEAYRILGDAQRAISYHEQALKIAQEIGDLQVEGNAFGNMGSVYIYQSNYHQALQSYERALSIYRKLGDRQRESACLSNLGNARATMGEYSHAIELYKQALMIDKDTDNLRGQGNNLNNIGEAYRNLGDAQRATEYYILALEKYRLIGDRGGEGAALGNLGIAYRILGQPRRAIQYYEQALEIWREIGNRRDEAADLRNLANANIVLGDTLQALEHYEQALEIARDVGDLNGVALASFNIAKLSADDKDAARALLLAKEAAQIWTQIGSPNAQPAQALVMKLHQLTGKKEET
jgi:serine/threonine protein kinase